MENAGYIFAAFTIVWLMVFGYLFVILKRQGRLKKEIGLLKKEAEGKEEK